VSYVDGLIREPTPGRRRSQEDTMTTQTRIPPTELTGVFGSVVKVAARRMLGQVPESMGVLAHHPALMRASMGIGRKIEALHELDRNLATYAVMATAAYVGCSWCLDFNYFKAHNEGLDELKASEVPRWRDSAAFAPLERDVMEYAEAMSETPPRVTDELSARLLTALGAPALVELTAVVGFANSTTRGNIALGIESQGFSKVCAVPLATRPTRTATSA
jgi:alkylhydroperoxidase family enzyme